MPACQGKLSDGNPCTKTLKRGKNYCRWHDPEDESWREAYARLETATPEEKTDIVLELIEDHPEHKLLLPTQENLKANLTKMDISTPTLEKRRSLLEGKKPPWWIEKTTILHFDGSFQGVNLSEANLRGANLTDANLEGTDLRGANFMLAELVSANLSTAQLQGAEFWGANLQGALLRFANLQATGLERANLEGAFLNFTDLQRSILKSANLQGADLDESNLQYADLRWAKLQGVDLSKVKSMFGIYLSDAWLDRTRMRREQFGSAIGEELKRDYASAKRGYLALKQNFDDLGDYDASSWAYRKERRMEKLEAWQIGRAALSNHRWGAGMASYFRFLKDLGIELLCDYGESAWRVIGWMLALLFVVGPLLFSGLGGVNWNTELSQEYFALSSLGKLWFLYIHYFLYTLDVFTTASFSGLEPINNAVKVASGFFAIAGIFLAGLLGFVAGNRIRRS